MSCPAVLAVVVPAARVVAAGILKMIRLRARLAAACLMAVFLAVLARMFLVLMATARAAETSRVLVLVRHDRLSICR